MTVPAVKRAINQSLVILLSSSFLLSAIAANTEEKEMSNDQTKILNTITTMTAAFHSKDMDGILASYESGAAVMFEPGQAITDTEQLKQMFGGAFQINPEFTYPNGHEVYIANDIALHIAPWNMTGKAPDGSILSDSGLSVAVLRKQANGEWLMVLDNPNGQSLMTH